MLNLTVSALSLNFFHVFILFVVDIHQIMLISLCPTPFGHFQNLGSEIGQNPELLLTLLLDVKCLLIYRKLHDSKTMKLDAIVVEVDSGGGAPSEAEQIVGLLAARSRFHTFFVMFFLLQMNTLLASLN